MRQQFVLPTTLVLTNSLPCMCTQFCCKSNLAYSGLHFLIWQSRALAIDPSRPAVCNHSLGILPNLFFFLSTDLHPAGHFCLSSGNGTQDCVHMPLRPSRHSRNEPTPSPRIWQYHHQTGTAEKATRLEAPTFAKSGSAQPEWFFRWPTIAIFTSPYLRCADAGGTPSSAACTRERSI